MVTPGPPGGWDFTPGYRIRDEVFSRFSCPVHFSRYFSRRPFLLVVDFPRSSFRLCTWSVGLALRACIGGSPGDLFVSHLKEHSFSFMVCSKAVGLWIYKLRSYICKDFHARFYLWRDGGPNWQRELDLWRSEQLSEWRLVSKKTKKKPVPLHPKKALMALSDQPKVPKPVVAPSGHIIPIKSVFDRLKFPVTSAGKSVISAGKPPNSVKGEI